MPEPETLPAGMDRIKGLLGQGRLDDAYAAAAALCESWPDAFEPAFYAGSIALQQAKPDEACVRFETAHKADPDHIETMSLLARLRERANAFAEAGEWADKVLAREPGHAYALAVRAGAHLEAGEPEFAIELITRSFRREGIAPLEAAAVLERLGQARHAMKDYEGAYAAFDEGNALVRAAYAPSLDPLAGDFTLAGARRVRDFFSAAGPRPLPTPPDELPDPVFLVGFPRSGTTLLEQVLASHPAIETTDERPIFEPICRAAGSTPQTLARFLEAGPGDLRRMRSWYWKAARPEGAPGPGRIFIDKLPTNAIWLGVIAKVFPRAKILLALRDPRDCVLSAWMQTLDMNPIGFRMLDLADCASLYDAVMGGAEAARRAWPDLPVHEVKYESVVADLETEARRAIAFLGLDWDPAVLAYRDTLEDKRISTPSARQVIRPVYAHAVEKWRRYAFGLDAAMPALRPWIRRWGYEADPREADGGHDWD